ncbi:carbohydrate ABC transporter permease, partial [Klebsiella pneumoniae]|nr:carbohydrate ABC transporter permease [Klebsiella pneumoniae]
MRRSPLSHRNTGSSTPPIREAKMADIQQMAPVMSDADREVARTLRREKVSRVVRYVVLI